MKLIGHLFRHNTFTKNIFEEKISGEKIQRTPKHHHISKTSKHLSWRS